MHLCLLGVILIGLFIGSIAVGWALTGMAILVARIASAIYFVNSHLFGASYETWASSYLATIILMVSICYSIVIMSAMVIKYIQGKTDAGPEDASNV